MVSNPEVQASLVPAGTPVANIAQKILFVGQQTAVATATVDLLTENIGVNGEESGLFGRTSILAKVITAFKKANPVSQVDSIGVGDGTTARVHTATVAGTATEAGTINFVAGSKKNASYPIPVANGDTAAAIGTLIQAAINADLDNHFTASGVSPIVTLTADTKGTASNHFPIGWYGTMPAGLSIAFVETAPGATDPDTSATLDVVGDRRYQLIVWCLDVTEGSTDDVVTFLDSRFNSTTGKVEDGVVFYTNIGTLTPLLSKNNAFNSENAWPMCYNKITDAAKYFGPHLMEHPDEVNAYFGGIMTLRLTDGESISQFLTTTQTGEAFGGPRGASLPLFNTPLKGIVGLAEPGREFEPLEISQISDSGGSVFGNNDADTEVITGAILTTYKTLASGVPDLTWKFGNYRLTGAGIREFYHSNLKQRYGQSRLTEGDLVEGAAMNNLDSIRAFVVRLYSTLAGQPFLLTRKGEANLKFFKENLRVTADFATGIVTIEATFPIVTQMRQINMALKIAFSTGGA